MPDCLKNYGCGCIPGSSPSGQFRLGDPDQLFNGGSLPEEWRPHAEVMSKIWDHFVITGINLFEFMVTARCGLFFSRGRNDAPLDMVAMPHQWPQGLLYPFLHTHATSPTEDPGGRGESPDRPWIIMPCMRGARMLYNHMMSVSMRQPPAMCIKEYPVGAWQSGEEHCAGLNAAARLE